MRPSLRHGNAYTHYDM
jgi:hypothetical protein